jgi:hypothetical protein
MGQAAWWQVQVGGLVVAVGMGMLGGLIGQGWNWVFSPRLDMEQ